MDTKFSIAVHLLILISEAERPLSSAQMAASVGTNPSYVRKVLGALKSAKLIDSHQGKAGFELQKSPVDISLLQVAQAVYGDDGLGVFEIHKNPNDNCLVGRYIKPTLNSVFEKAQKEMEDSLAKTTLSDCINTMQQKMTQDGDNVTICKMVAQYPAPVSKW